MHQTFGPTFYPTFPSLFIAYAATCLQHLFTDDKKARKLKVNSDG